MNGISALLKRLQRNFLPLPPYEETLKELSVSIEAGL